MNAPYPVASGSGAARHKSFESLNQKLRRFCPSIVTAGHERQERIEEAYTIISEPQESFMSQFGIIIHCLDAVGTFNRISEYLEDEQIRLQKGIIAELDDRGTVVLLDIAIVWGTCIYAIRREDDVKVMEFSERVKAKTILQVNDAVKQGMSVESRDWIRQLMDGLWEQPAITDESHAITMAYVALSQVIEEAEYEVESSSSSSRVIYSDDGDRRRRRFRDGDRDGQGTSWIDDDSDQSRMPQGDRQGTSWIDDDSREASERGQS